MSPGPRVTLTANTLGIGGTEKAMTSYAIGLKRAGLDVSAVAVLFDGPPPAELEAAGLPVACAYGSEETFADLIRGSDVVHAVRHGTAEPIIAGAVRRAGVKHLVDLNIFGAVDESEDDRLYDCHLFMSRMCLLRYRDRVG